MFVMGGGYLPGTIPQTLGALAVLLATINVSGGFIITKRMLDMFKREFSTLFLMIITSLRGQDQLILLNILGYMRSLPPFSLVVSLLPPVLVWRGLFRRVT